MDTLSLFNLSGKTAIITGGGRGLGEYMAEALADAGANVVICSRKLEACEEVKNRIESKGKKAIAIPCDVTNIDDVNHVVKVTEEQFGSVDILVNNSGVSWGAPPEDMPVDKFEWVMDVNVKGVFLMSQAVGRKMIERGKGGRIINISSVAGLLASHPKVLQAVGYHASKGAVIQLTKELAASWGQYNITVNSIAPGWFPTKMSRAIVERSRDFILPLTPLQRYGEADDLKGVVVFLASNASSYITGQTIVVDGGASIM